VPHDRKTCRMCADAHGDAEYCTACQRAEAAWRAEQDREYRAQWASEAYGPETSFDAGGL
jgi:hypothetical protein